MHMPATALLLLASFTACMDTTETPMQEPTKIDFPSGKTIETLCTYNADTGQWDDCGTQPGGGGGGGVFPINTCPSVNCDPTLGWIATLNCQSFCGPQFAAQCQPTYSQCIPGVDDCHSGGCVNWHQP